MIVSDMKYHTVKIQLHMIQTIREFNPGHKCEKECKQLLHFMMPAAKKKP